METATKQKKISAVTPRRALSAEWKRAAGMLRHHKKALERHIKRVRNEWKGR